MPLSRELAAERRSALNYLIEVRRSLFPMVRGPGVEFLFAEDLERFAAQNLPEHLAWHFEVHPNECTGAADEYLWAQAIQNTRAEGEK